MPQTLLVHEIYLSLQGESTHAGLPCVFVRLTGCDLRCSYCDTTYAFRGGETMPVPAVISRVEELSAGFPEKARLPLVEITGGEPLLQKNALLLMQRLCDAGFTVLIETSGAHDIGGIDPRVRRIVDLKCPGSGESGRMRWENIRLLKATDEVKFVICSQEDYDWAKQTISEHQLAGICPVLISWASPLTPAQSDPSLKKVPSSHHPIDSRQLCEQIVRDRLPVRFQLQMHKFIWPLDAKGV